MTKATDIANAITVACCLHSIIEGNAEVQVGVSRNKGVIFFSIEVYGCSKFYPRAAKLRNALLEKCEEKVRTEARRAAG